MARKKNESKPDLGLKTVVIDESIPKAPVAKGKNKVITTSDLERPEKIKAVKKYNPGDDTFLRMGRGEKPHKWKDGKPL